jgi:outer membrane protein OmpA-like peptidoglycan-associated protein
MRLFYTYIVFLLLIICTSFSAFAQDDDEEIDPNCIPPTEKKLAKLWDKANDNSNDYKTRITSLKAILDVNEDCAPCMWNMAQETFKRSKISGSSYGIPKKYYHMLEYTCPDYHADVYFNLALIYYSEQSDCEALKYFDKFLNFPTDDEKKLSRTYDKQVASVEDVKDEADFYCNFFKNEVPFDPVLVKNVSTAGRDEYLPIISPDNELIFYTQEFEYKAKGDPITQVIQAFTESSRPNALADFSVGTPLAKPFNIGPKYGGASISIDNKEMYVCACQSQANYWNCDIFMTKYDIVDVKGVKKYIWSDLENIGTNVNGKNSWEAQPSLSADGQTLYFASARPGGLGSVDIYYSERAEDGSWGPAKNMGPTINSAGSDKSPFLHCDSRTLYFVSETSASRLGAGGFDIFFSKQDKATGKWSKPKNIGYPINTAGDEEALIVSTDGNKGYFSSDMTRGGVGKKDIFYFRMPEFAKPDKVNFITGTIKTENIESIKDAEVEVRLKDGTVTKHQIKVQDNGKYTTVVNVGDGKQDALVQVKKEGKAFNSTLIEASSVKNTFVKEKEVVISDIKKGSFHTINNIYFKTNSSEIDEKSKLVLDAFTQWLQENPNVSIEIQGHTDDLGNNSDNLALSQDRAYSVMEYIALKGVKASRVKFKGYGETKPKVKNDSVENRAKNRRTDFMIL